MNIRIVLWTLCLAYVGFLLVGGKAAPSSALMITGTALGAMMGFALGVMFKRRAQRKNS